MKKDFKIYTDYHQFFIEDSGNENKGSSASADSWNEKRMRPDKK